MAQTAQTAMETWSTENSGEYTLGTRAKLNEIEKSINIAASTSQPELKETSLTVSAAGVASGNPSATEYGLTVKAANTGDEYSIVRKTSGVVEHLCHSAKTECPGKVANSSTW
jgi:hypothetical protein